MTLSDFRLSFFDRYSANSYETQQKAYLPFWGCIWACLLTFAALTYSFFAYYQKADLIAFKYIFVNLGISFRVEGQFSTRGF
jgi:hypothetical protein